MKKFIFLSLIFFVFNYNSFSQIFGKVYEHPKVYHYVSKHKKIAVVPFNYKISLKKMPKNTTQDDIIDSEKDGSTNAQARLEIFILNKISRGLVNIDLMETTRVNALLKRNDIDIHNIQDYLPEEICRTLNVDAIITGQINSTRIMSRGGAIATQILLGHSVGDKSSASISIYDKSGTRIWNYGKEITVNAFSNDDDIIRVLMRKTSRRFPYSEKNF